MTTSLQAALPHCPEGRWTRLPDALLSVLTPREHQLTHALLSYRWTDDAPIIPSVKTLARQVGCSVRTVQRTTASLVARGYLLIEARYRADEGQTSNRYVPGPLLVPLLTSTTVTSDARPGQAWHRGASPLPPKRDPGKPDYGKKRPGTGPAPLSVGRCYGCGGDHGTPRCPRYGRYFQGKG